MVTLRSPIFFWRGMLASGIVVVGLAFPLMVMAQTPTPWPTPTPIVQGDFVVQQSVTYGEGGVIVGLVFVAGLMLLDIMIRLSERLTDR